MLNLFQHFFLLQLHRILWFYLRWSKTIPLKNNYPVKFVFNSIEIKTREKYIIPVGYL